MIDHGSGGEGIPHTNGEPHIDPSAAHAQKIAEEAAAIAKAGHDAPANADHPAVNAETHAENISKQADTMAKEAQAKIDESVQANAGTAKAKTSEKAGRFLDLVKGHLSEGRDVIKNNVTTELKGNKLKLGVRAAGVGLGSWVALKGARDLGHDKEGHSHPVLGTIELVGGPALAVGSLYVNRSL